MKRALVLLMHLFTCIIIQIAALGYYIFENQISILQKGIALLAAIVLLFCDYFVGLHVADSQHKWIHCFDLPLLCVPSGYVAYMTMSTIKQYGFVYYVQLSDIVLLAGIFTIEICLLGERIRLFHLSGLPDSAVAS